MVDSWMMDENGSTQVSTGGKPADPMRHDAKGFATPQQQARDVGRSAVRAGGQEMSSGRRVIIMFL